MPLPRVIDLRREEWLEALASADPKEDKFAKTFRSKADAMDLWKWGRALWVQEGDIMALAAGIVVRPSKRAPVVANLQLLHTFARFRRKGYAARLVKEGFATAVDRYGAQYFRVSSEQEALPFYRALGFAFWGKQKSGSELSIFRVRGPEIRDGVYEEGDYQIHAAVFSGRRGGVVELHEGGPR